MSHTKKKKSSWTLKCSYGNNKSLQIFDLNYGVNNIGRSKNNTIVLHNETISKYHCQLVIENNDIPIIKDVGSKNGTTVQELKLEGIEDCILKENDTIYLSDNGISLLICKKAHIENEKTVVLKVDNISENANLLNHNATRTNIQEKNESDSIISHHNNKNNNPECQLIKINEIVKDRNYVLKQEQLASKWVHCYLQNLMNNNSDDDDYET